MLVDLKRIPEARIIYEKLVGLAPWHAHFLTELGQSYRPEGNWPKMLDICTTAKAAAELASDDTKMRQKILARHCMGFALSEQGKFNEAEALYRECLKLDPDDTNAKNELQYIAEQRRKRS